MLTETQLREANEAADEMEDLVRRSNEFIEHQQTEKRIVVASEPSDEVNHELNLLNALENLSSLAAHAIAEGKREQALAALKRQREMIRAESVQIKARHCQ